MPRIGVIATTLRSGTGINSPHRSCVAGSSASPALYALFSGTPCSSSTQGWSASIIRYIVAATPMEVTPRSSTARDMSTVAG